MAPGFRQAPWVTLGLGVALVLQDGPRACGDGHRGEHHEHQHDVARGEVLGRDAERDHRGGEPEVTQGQRRRR
jgi:hypothetical protein